MKTGGKRKQVTQKPIKKEQEKDANPVKKQKISGPAFEWEDDESKEQTEHKDSKNEESENEQASEDEDEVSKKQVKNLKEKKKKLTEEMIRKREQELVDGNIVPQTDEDFERIIVSKPQSSFIWIQYMAFKLSVSDIDGARRIGERALKSIRAELEQDRFNVFAALMNLESKFGNDVTQQHIFEKARQLCDPKRVYLQQAKIYEQNNDTSNAEEYYKKASKKFKQSKKVWEAYELFELKRGNLKEANQILQQSLLSLPKRKHVNAITSFATLHYKYGSAVQGNKLLEGVVSNYPLRTDIWSIFIDVELSAKRIDFVRNLFQRVVTLKLSTKKMKSFLQRFLKFEQDHGTEEGQAYVKQVATQYIQHKTNNIVKSATAKALKEEDDDNEEEEEEGQEDDE